MQPPFPPAAPPGGYEFSEPENQVFRDLAQGMRRAVFAQVASLVAGLLSVAVTVPRLRGASMQVGGAVGGVGALLVSAVFAGFIAYFLGRSAAAFERVANTRGEDVPNLVAALAAQRSYFGMLKWLSIAGLVIAVLACVAALALGVLFTASHASR